MYIPRWTGAPRESQNETSYVPNGGWLGRWLVRVVRYPARQPRRNRARPTGTQAGIAKQEPPPFLHSFMGQSCCGVFISCELIPCGAEKRGWLAGPDGARGARLSAETSPAPSPSLRECGGSRRKRTGVRYRPNGLPCVCCLAPARDAIGALLRKNGVWRWGNGPPLVFSCAHGDGDFSCRRDIQTERRRLASPTDSVCSYLDQ